MKAYDCSERSRSRLIYIDWVWDQFIGKPAALFEDLKDWDAIRFVAEQFWAERHGLA